MSHWGVFRVLMTVIAVVIVGSVIFIGSQLVLRGHVDETLSISSIDLESAARSQNAGANTLHANPNETYHYDFFALLDQPLAERQLPPLNLAENPSMKLGAGVKLSDYKLTGNFAIQVSSFSTLADAESLARELQTQGYLSVIASDHVDGKTRYRVRVDGGKKREQAEQKMAAIALKTGLQGFIVTL